ncbi:hypothetical protein H8F24_15745 [Synechococcus sp. CBW1002]|uniref:hypothetical protein n=1 Tax=Synechococcus sp. CBW1002 TaxID=1353134 RepID=UPI0018CDA624|nr:hypothetical protein [Synechococcus sp. CBW1002]QPN59451.1 hypothetical protein H8F24_15745 [Synechococcus sp. CBW1002]
MATDLSQLVAAAADLCRKPLRHAVLLDREADQVAGPPHEDLGDCCLRLEARAIDGERRPDDDLDLELYRSGGTLNLTLAWRHDPDRPMLWHGNHPVWMDGVTGLRCERPADGAGLEALARRLRALLGSKADPQA